MSSASIAPMTLPRTPSGGRVTQLSVIVSEWTKFRSLRSTRYTLLATVGLTVGLALAAAILVVTQWGTMTPANKATFQPLNVSLVGASIGVMVIGVLGVLMMTSEYATGLVSSTFAAVPKRLPVLWGKAAVYTAIALAVTVPAMLIAFFSTQAILSGTHVQMDFGHAGVARAVIGSALYLTIAGLFGLRARRYLPQHRCGGHQPDGHPLRPARDHVHPACERVEHHQPIPPGECRAGHHGDRSASAHALAVGWAWRLRRICTRGPGRRGGAPCETRCLRGTDANRYASANARCHQHTPLQGCSRPGVIPTR